MRPALEPGDWLLVDPTTQRWPRRGAIVVVREPGSGLLVVKRVAGRPGDTISLAGRPVRLGPTEAWLLGDAPAVSIDSRLYGPVRLDRLVGRAWLRYGPLGRPLGLIDRPAVGREPARRGGAQPAAMTSRPSRSIIARSRGMKSWSMSRSTPRAASSAILRRARSGVPMIQVGSCRANQASPSSGTREAGQHGGPPPGELGLVGADQHADHRRAADRARVPPDRPAGLVELRRSARRSHPDRSSSG